MKKDLRDEKVTDITEKTTFENMAQDPLMNPKNRNLPMPFFKGSDDCLLREGEVGQWRKHSNDAQLEFIDRKTKEIPDLLVLNFHQ